MTKPDFIPSLPRPCWFMKWTSGSAPWEKGILYAWGTDNESSECSMPIPVGIVERCETGEVLSIPVVRINLGDVMPVDAP